MPPDSPSLPDAARVLMIQGTTSDAGKSLVVTGLGRLLHRRGIDVAPFKPQNMALNSAVATDGGEIGRAQAIQALACGLEPHVDMNPVLLKPNSDRGAQVIIGGKPFADLDAQGYHQFKPAAMEHVLAAFRRLSHRHRVVLVEGAGSPAEINLRDRDIANMGFAEAVDCPVILVGDIDRGGVFAHLVGTLALLSASERARVKGFIINKFRGDLALLRPGLLWLERETGKPVLGVLPFLPGLYLAAEDSFFQETGAAARGEGVLRVAAPRFPRVSNHTDLDPLRLHPRVQLRWVGEGEAWPSSDLILLPGSKSVRADLAWLRRQGWEEAILTHLRYGGKLVGLCGGFQMLGEELDDSLGVEGPPGRDAGLGLLSMTTVFGREKTLRNTEGVLCLDGVPVRGYEIHLGHSAGPALERPAMILEGRPHGAISADGRILGGYLHGLFDTPQACMRLLTWAGLREAEALDLVGLREAAFERLADACAAHLDVARMVALLGLEWT